MSKQLPYEMRWKDYKCFPNKTDISLVQPALKIKFDVQNPVKSFLSFD